MFLAFMMHLRRRGIQVSLSEWLALMEALNAGLGKESLLAFYHLCRAICVHHETQFDLFDACFAEFFKDVTPPQPLHDELFDWLRNAKLPPQLNLELMQKLTGLSLEELRKMFEERLREQTERHDGGNRWIGTGGTSPFGHSGTNAAGIRVGGQSRLRSAVQVASARAFRNLRHDRELDDRQMGLALKKFRQLARVGSTEELDVEATVGATCRNGGEIDLVYQRARQNSVKLLLMLDVGGSMTAHSRRCEQLFSIAHGVNHFKSVEYFFFHNCPYEFVYTDIERCETIPTERLLQDFDDRWFLMVVGDAAMSPFELTLPGGSNDYFHHNPEPGLAWLGRIKQRFPKSVWLNPEPISYWEIQSNILVRRVFGDMFPLSVEGIEQAVESLLARN